MFQFIHVETYALKASTKQRPVKPPKDGKAPINPPKVKNKYSAGQIIDEVLREPDAIPHVANPEKPNFILGSEDDLRTLIPRIEAAAASYKNPKDGRKLRSDAHVLLAGVASYPREAAEDNPANYEKWKAKTVDFLREKYGNKLVSVVEHLDESQPHIHFYAVDFENLNAKMLHDGHRAAAQLPQLSKEAGLAFKGAMREYQNNYYQNVGAQVGLTRIGPGRKRATRDEWNAQKAEAKELSKAYEATSEIINEASLQAQSIVADAQQERIKLEQARRDFEVEQITFYEKRRELIAAMKKTRELQTKLHEVDVIQKFRHETLLKHENDYQEKIRLTDEIRLRLTDDYLREHGIGLNDDMVDVDFTRTDEWLDMCDPTKNNESSWHKSHNELEY